MYYNDDSKQKYETDPVFHQAVTLLEKIIAAGQMTPHELRQALTYACTRYELYHAAPSFVIEKAERQTQQCSICGWKYTPPDTRCGCVRY